MYPSGNHIVHQQFNVLSKMDYSHTTSRSNPNTPCARWSRVTGVGNGADVGFGVHGGRHNCRFLGVVWDRPPMH